MSVEQEFDSACEDFEEATTATIARLKEIGRRQEMENQALRMEIRILEARLDESRHARPGVPTVVAHESPASVMPEPQPQHGWIPGPPDVQHKVYKPCITCGCSFWGKSLDPSKCSKCKYKTWGQRPVEPPEHIGARLR